MFSSLKQHFTKIYSQVTSALGSLFASQKVDEETITELQKILLQADAGVATTKKIIAAVRAKAQEDNLFDGQALNALLNKELQSLLTDVKEHDRQVYMLVGINGSGKTTFAAKLAQYHSNKGKRVVLVAADTFRAAAVEQLQTWAERVGTKLVTGKQNDDPASVVFRGCEEYLNGDYDVLIIDTAGRLQTKVNLMNELEKVVRVARKKLGEKPLTTLLTVDAMLGNNSFTQAQMFKESTQLDGVVLTKMDGTGKGGIVFAINQELGVPVWFTSFGESVSDLALFNPEKYVQELLQS